MPQDLIAYEKRFVAFLDVLGFKAMVSGKDGLTKVNDYLLSVKTELAKNLNGLKFSVDAITISDSVILSVPVFLEENAEKEKLLAQFCDLISDIQCALALKDIWMRGAITYGDCYISTDPSQIIGPAYIKAYELEQNVAKYPRIIIDPKIVRELACGTDKELIDKINEYPYSGKIFDWYKRSECHKIDKDVPLFIDYFEQLFIRELHPDIHPKINAIIDYVSRNLFVENWSLDVYGKHQWTLKYLHSKIIVNLSFSYNDQLSESAKIKKRIENL